MKKITKILSLALALALVLSTNAFAAVYYTQDFDYTDTDAVLDDVATFAYAAKVNQEASTAIAQRVTTGKNMMIRSYTGGAYTSTSPALLKESGINWFKFHTDTTLTNQTGNFVVVPNSTWDYTANQNETYVISYDLKIAPTGTATYNNAVETLWTDAAETSTGKADRIFAMRTDDATATDVFTAQFITGAFTNYVEDTAATTNVKHKFAAGYRYDADLTYPHKTTAYDGVTKGTSTITGPATNATPKLAAFTFAYNYSMGASISNIKMYTISNVAGAFNASVVTESIPATDARVTVKFSQPVGAFDKTAVTVNGLTYGTDFTVSDITEVVTTTDVYSTATVNFTKELAGATTYTINLPAATTNEIGTALSNTAVTFTTETAPTYALTLSGYEGLEAGTTQIAANAMAGKTVYFTATATNQTGRATSGALAIGIYDAQGNLVKYAFANKAFATSGTDATNTFSAAFKVEDGQTAKAFVNGTASEITFQ